MWQIPLEAWKAIVVTRGPFHGIPAGHRQRQVAVITTKHTNDTKKREAEVEQLLKFTIPLNESSEELQSFNP